MDDYRGFVWCGNVKVGPKFTLGDNNSAVIVPYGVVDWTWSPSHEERWWENFVRVGGGIRLYPWAKKPETPNKRPCRFLDDLARRFYIYAEVVDNVAWLGSDAPSDVHDIDVRFGIAFSTSGFFAEP